ncbi:MAG TPA: EamA family transporter [Clostridiaceae bacterium]|nr:EamA family transporter [Clostridiaceae bacterium]
MNAAFYHAIVGAVLNAANDLLYRSSSAGKNREQVLSFYFFSSAFSAIISFVAGLFMYKGAIFDIPSIVYGVILGILSFSSYILFLFSFTGNNTSTAVTIFRLNMIPSIILAVIFLNERISLRRGIGIALSISCIFLIAGFNISSKEEKKTRLLDKSTIMSLGACLFAGFINFANKLAVNAGTQSFNLLLWRYIVVSLIAGLFLFKERRWEIKAGQWNISKKGLLIAFVSSVILWSSIVNMLIAMKTGDVAMIIPITQMAIVIIAVISWLFLKEKMHLRKVAGILLAVAAVILISGD